MSWGYHLTIDAAACKGVDDKENILAFVKELIPAIDMIAFGDTWIQRFATHDATKSGFSMFQMIETSNISAHFCEVSGDAYFDVFSCKDFDSAIVENLVNQYFSPKAYKVNKFERDVPKIA